MKNKRLVVETVGKKRAKVIDMTVDTLQAEFYEEDKKVYCEYLPDMESAEKLFKLLRVIASQLTDDATPKEPGEVRNLIRDGKKRLSKASATLEKLSERISLEEFNLELALIGADQLVKYVETHPEAVQHLSNAVMIDEKFYD